ncbi:MAG: hypothetical protein K1X44_05675 [Alphaproteobacteria bacterium]|nr:hypothetical protein [Alphaproteobacteria bacterium]
MKNGDYNKNLACRKVHTRRSCAKKIHEKKIYLKSLDLQSKKINQAEKKWAQKMVVRQFSDDQNALIQSETVWKVLSPPTYVFSSSSADLAALPNNY